MTRVTMRAVDILDCTLAWASVFEALEVAPSGWSRFALEHLTKVQALAPDTTADILKGRGVSNASIQRYTGTGGKDPGVPHRPARLVLKAFFSVAIADLKDAEKKAVQSLLENALAKSKAYWEERPKAKSSSGRRSSASPRRATQESIDLAPSNQVLSVIDSEVHLLQEEMQHALMQGSWKALRGTEAWDHASKKLRDIQKRHCYMELMSLIEPTQWLQGKWAGYHQELVERSMEASPDAVRRLHVLDGRMLPDELQQSKNLSEELRRSCSMDTTTEQKAENIRQVRAMILAEYVAGIRARVLFLCRHQMAAPYWPKIENSYLLDVGTYYQTGTGYRVILSNLKPLQDNYLEDELVIYQFHHDVGTERLYWLLRANYFRLLRSNSSQLFNLFDLFPNEQLEGQVDWSLVEEFLPPKLRDIIGKGIQDLIVSRFHAAAQCGLRMEYEFERLLKTEIERLRLAQ